jgi:hypothetical protein
MGLPLIDVRFTPKSGHRSARRQCPFCHCGKTYSINLVGGSKQRRRYAALYFLAPGASGFR